jgi:hypothetical protein
MPKPRYPKSKANEEMRSEEAMRRTATLITTMFSSTGLKPGTLPILSPMVEKK